MAAAQGADQRNLARGAGLAHPVGVAAGADQIAPPADLDRVDRQRDCPAALSAADFENVEVTADEANPNNGNKEAAKDAFDRAWAEISLSILWHRSVLPNSGVIKGR
jgi:hypothetical protein